MSKRLSAKGHRNRFIFFLILALLLIIFAISAPGLAPNDPLETHADAMKAVPCKDFPLGTDKLGRCVLSRTLMGTPTSIFSALLLVAISFVVGTALGMISGYFGGIVDTVIMRIADVLLAFPQMVLAIAVAGVLGGGLVNAMIALGITSWTLYARLARSSVLKMKGEPFMAAAYFSKCSDIHIMIFHLLPNLAGPLLVNATTQIGTTMIEIAGLSFLGIGVIPPQAEWGSMINESRAYMQLAPWAVIAPSVAIIITVVIFNCLGDAVRDWMDAKQAYDEK